MNVRIRSGSPADAPALAALAAVTFPLAAPDHTSAVAIADFVAEMLSSVRFATYLTDPSRVLLVAEPADGLERAGLATSVGPLVAYAMLVLGEPDDADVSAAVTTRPTVDLNKFYVHPDRHGTGVADELMQAVVDAARTWCSRSVWLGVNIENARANRFYDRHGFSMVGTRHFRVGDRLEDDFVRELVL